jgi:hypothetical protein
VILQQDVSLDTRAEAGDALEFAVLDGRCHRGASKLVFQHLHAVEPVLDVVARDEHP